MPVQIVFSESSNRHTAILLFQVAVGNVQIINLQLGPYFGVGPGTYFTSLRLLLGGTFIAFKNHTINAGTIPVFRISVNLILTYREVVSKEDNEVPFFIIEDSPLQSCGESSTVRNFSNYIRSLTALFCSRAARNALAIQFKEVIMNFKSIEEVLDYAIEKEKEAAEFYEDISRQEPFSGTREAFEDFAKEEKKHQILLENFAENKEKIAGYQYKWVPDLKRSDYLVDIEYVKGMHFTDILRLAMKREEKALQLYNGLAGKADNDDFIKLFKLLAQEEAKHKSALETIYDDYMAGQGD